MESGQMMVYFLVQHWRPEILGAAKNSTIRYPTTWIANGKRTNCVFMPREHKNPSLWLLFYLVPSQSGDESKTFPFLPLTQCQPLLKHPLIHNQSNDLPTNPVPKIHTLQLKDVNWQKELKGEIQVVGIYKTLYFKMCIDWKWNDSKMMLHANCN